MKSILYVTLFFVSAMVLSAFTSSTVTQEEVELICIKKHNASNTCHYNFKIGGINYRYLDIGCKGKKDDVVKKVKAGKLGLAQEWKIACPEPKEKPSH